MLRQEHNQSVDKGCLECVQTDGSYEGLVGDPRDPPDLLKNERAVVLELASFEDVPEDRLHFYLIVDFEVDIVDQMVPLNRDDRNRLDDSLDDVVDDLPFLEELHQIDPRISM